MENFKLKYFLATNSCEGFISSFGDCYNAFDGWHTYIIKGGPGTGKSSFMKSLVKKAEEKGIKAEIFPCSSDPDSLDAVIFPDKKTVILDGTAPHTLDPSFPAVCEEILNFGDFWNSEVLLDQSDDILRLTNENKALHRIASSYISSVGVFLTDNFKTAKACTDKNKVISYSKKLCKKLIPKRSSDGKEWVRYLCGISPKGVISYTDTILNLTNQNIIIRDEYGFVANVMMHQIREYALNNGYEIITVKNSFLPSTLIDHIIIPELSLSFAREYEYQPFKTSIRRIHARRFTSALQLSKSRERIRFNKKTIKELLCFAVSVLSQAKSTHDRLEAFYIKAMDFEKLNRFTDDFAERIIE